MIQQKKLNKLKVLYTVYDEKYKAQCKVVTKKRGDLDASESELLKIIGDVKYYTFELEKYLSEMNSSSLHEYENYKNHIASLYEMSKEKSKEVDFLKNQLEIEQKECTRLGIESKKIEKLRENITLDINNQVKRLEFKEADEMWNIRTKL